MKDYGVHTEAGIYRIVKTNGKGKNIKIDLIHFILVISYAQRCLFFGFFFTGNEVS